MNLKQNLLLALALAGCAGAIQAADGSTVVEINGSVMVNRGDSFVAATDGMSVGKGSQVMAMDGATAIVRYKDGCDLKVEPGTVVTLGDRSPCAGWIPQVEAVSPGSVALGGGAAGAGSGGVSASTIAGVVGGAVAVSLAVDRLNDDDDEDEPVSP